MAASKKKADMAVPSTPPPSSPSTAAAMPRAGTQRQSRLTRTVLFEGQRCFSARVFLVAYMGSLAKNNRGDSSKTSSVPGRNRDADIGSAPLYSSVRERDQDCIAQQQYIAAFFSVSSLKLRGNSGEIINTACFDWLGNCQHGHLFPFPFAVCQRLGFFRVLPTHYCLHHHCPRLAPCRAWSMEDRAHAIIGEGKLAMQIKNDTI